MLEIFAGTLGLANIWVAADSKHQYNQAIAMLGSF